MGFLPSLGGDAVFLCVLRVLLFLFVFWSLVRVLLLLLSKAICLPPLRVRGLGLEIRSERGVQVDSPTHPQNVLVSSAPHRAVHPSSLCGLFLPAPPDIVGVCGFLPLFSCRRRASTPRIRRWRCFCCGTSPLRTLGSILAWRAILSGSHITLHG